MSDLMYRHFLAKPCKSYPFLAEQLDKMYVDQAGMRHAVLVMGAEDSGGVLVESEEVLMRDMPLMYLMPSCWPIPPWQNLQKYCQKS